MRIAVISDVHGNCAALENVIEDAIKNDVDKFIFVGDYIFDMPFSNEVVRLLMKLKNAHIIKGNKEGYLSNLAKSDQSGWTYDQIGGIYQTFRELSPDVYDFLDNLDDECHIQINPYVCIYAVHAPKFFKPSPKTDCSSSNFHRKMLKEPFSHEQFLSEFNDLINRDEIKNQIEKIDANIIIFGHDHLQRYGYCGNKLIINPGSCGQPLDFDPDPAYSIIEETDVGFDVIEKRVKYDIECAIDQAKGTMVYEKSKIWSELVFLSLKTGRDYFGMFFEIANQIAESKNEKGAHFSNSTWAEAREVFKDRHFV